MKFNMKDIETNLKEYGEILDHIFNPICKEICNNCAEAHYKTVIEAIKSGDYASKEAGCCSKCAKAEGYLYSSDTGFLCDEKNSNIEREQMKQLFSFDKEIYGFFNPLIKSCRIPRYLRSDICLRYMCDDFKDRLTERYGKGIFTFVFNMRNELLKNRNKLYEI